MQSETQPALFGDLLDFEFRWPKRGDRLFMPASDLNVDAEIHSSGISRAVFLTSGYKAAADSLVERALEDRVARHDLVYPIIFCYRQFIELSLKSQISDYGSSVDGFLPGPRKAHDLKALLKAFRKMCLRLGGSDVHAVIAVSKCILEFDRMDPTSFTFRYPTQKNGDPYSVPIDRVDLSRLKDVMDGIGGFFTGSDSYYWELFSNSY